MADYEAIAEIIRSKKNEIAETEREDDTDRILLWSFDKITNQIAIDLADHFEQDNPKFDRSRFLKACGLE